MATMNFSLPDELKARFDAAFIGENKSAVLAGLMDEAIERKQIQARRKAVLDQVRAWQESADAAPSATNTNQALREYRDARVDQLLEQHSNTAVAP
jgi:predicted transcriptional regulator